MGIAVGVLSANYMTDTGEVSFASARKTVFSSSFENAVQKATRESFEHSITDENSQKSTSYTRFVGEIYTEDTLGTSNNAASGSKRVEQLVKLYGEESPYSKALWGIGQAFDATFPNAPANVREAWIDMCIDSGMNQITGTSLDGKTSHLSQIMVQKAVNDYNIANGNFQNVDAGWGESVESIINILKKGIYDIDNPLPGDVEKSAAVKKLIENERVFYVSFLDKLEILD